MHQIPTPGVSLILNAGDTVSFSLAVESTDAGAAWLRTNLRGSAVRRAEIVKMAEEGTPRLDSDWFDIPMNRTTRTEFSVTVPVFEPGIFEAKTLFIPEGSSHPAWPEGENVLIKVEPSIRASGNSIYSAFVRLFGDRPDPAEADQLARDEIKVLDEAGYTVIPRSGKFRDLIAKLDHIVDGMGFRNILLLPIHPTPTTYARMGRFGSPFAAIDLMDVDPALAEFDRRTTPLDQFRELIDAAHARGASLFMDMPLNHTGWASTLQIHHPSWFHRDKKRHFQSPGAWGVTWEDLAELNYDDKGLWQYMAGVFLYWCRQGVDGFRCDAGYMVPAEVWEYITAKVRSQFPDTVFLLEGLGGKKETMRRLLTSSNLDWAYSELFQNYDRGQIESYIQESDHFSKSAGLLVHFSETHDNDRLAAASHQYARMRTSLAALLSHRGAFGITCGVEWFADEKIDVHERTHLNWGAQENLIEHVRLLNKLLTSHPAFSPSSSIETVACGDANAVSVLRSCRASGSKVMVLANLDTEHPARLDWHSGSWPLPDRCRDLLTMESIDINTGHNGYSLDLAPGQALCLEEDSGQEEPVVERLKPEFQTAKALAIEIAVLQERTAEWTTSTPAELANELLADPEKFHASHVSRNGATPLVKWQWPADTRRTVPVPANTFILVRAGHPFQIDLSTDAGVVERRAALRDGNGWFTFLTRTRGLPGHAALELTVFKDGQAKRTSSDILFLNEVSGDSPITMTRTVSQVKQHDSSALCTNGRGAMSLVRAAWGEIEGQYDAILSGNLHPSAPSDRHIMLTRCRAWVVLRGFSQEVSIDCLSSFSAVPPHRAEWLFSIPTGMGSKVGIRTTLRMIEDRNAVDVHFERTDHPEAKDQLDKNVPIKLILRFDMEDRSFHTKTKAFAGPESSWPSLTTASKDGFRFAPAPERSLSVNMPGGLFTEEHEWSYMVAHPADSERGLDGHSDLFSPGYFTAELSGGESICVRASISEDDIPHPELPAPADTAAGRLADVLTGAMSQFVVRRDESKTVIAGYPWFLDWGRDTLICLRGMIAMGMREEAREILATFASFEERGTIPNMIRGDDVSNRDTSDAPLWMHVAASDLADLSGKDIFTQPCGGRNLGEVLVSIAENYLIGTPNGIRVDRESGLVFSPSHFTWMDTNFPAGTPRKGYPVEIQALWYRCLGLAAEITGEDPWKELQERVAASLVEYFYNDSLGYLSDCLHCDAGVTPDMASPDDHLRPNQLLAITLGAVTDSNICGNILEACQELLVPGAIRSLADRPVGFPLPVVHDGTLLNDPAHPYWGTYSGDEDTRRKPAYHNGTAWTWPMPSYCEAMISVHGDTAARAARCYLAGMLEVLNAGCLGQVPELTDGDSPHSEKGCTAQAWGVSEFARVLALLDSIR